MRCNSVTGRYLVACKRENLLAICIAVFCFPVCTRVLPCIQHTARFTLGINIYYSVHLPRNAYTRYGLVLLQHGINKLVYLIFYCFYRLNLFERLFGRNKAVAFNCLGINRFACYRVNNGNADRCRSYIYAYCVHNLKNLS